MWRDSLAIGPFGPAQLFQMGIRGNDYVTRGEAHDWQFASKEPFASFFVGADPTDEPRVGTWRIAIDRGKRVLIEIAGNRAAVATVLEICLQSARGRDAVWLTPRKNPIIVGVTSDSPSRIEMASRTIADQMRQAFPGTERLEVEATVIVVDIQGSTELLKRWGVVEYSRWFGELSDAIQGLISEKKGAANYWSKSTGDGLLLVYGLATSQRRHAEYATRAAMKISDMVRTAYGDDIRFRIGVATGNVVPSFFKKGGGEVVQEVNGETIAAAERLQSSQKGHDGNLWIAESTYMTIGARTRKYFSPLQAGLVRDYPDLIPYRYEKRRTE